MYGVVNAAYTIYDRESETDVSRHLISRKTLLRYIQDNKLNHHVIDPMTGDYGELDISEYLVDNLNDIVKMYLIENLK